MALNEVANVAGAVPSKDVAGQPEGDQKVDWAAKAKELTDQLTAAQSNLDSLKTESDRNVRRLQGTLQSQINSIKSQTAEEKQRWEDAYHKEKMAGMEEAEALRYEKTILSQRLQDREEFLAKVQQQTVDAQQAASYLQQFISLGVPVEKLNTRGSLQDLADSGWSGLQEARNLERSVASDYDKKLGDVQKQLDALKAGNADPNRLAEAAGDLPAQRILGPTGADARTGGMTELEAVKAAAQYFGGREPTLEELYRAVERKLLPPSVLPGMQGFTQPEISR